MVKNVSLCLKWMAVRKIVNGYDWSIVVSTPDCSDWLFCSTYSCINTEKTNSYKRKIKVGEYVFPGITIITLNDITKYITMMICTTNYTL